ncbi:unnamed protein product, partial [Urochloa humidicola]
PHPNPTLPPLAPPLVRSALHLLLAAAASTSLSSSPLPPPHPPPNRGLPPVAAFAAAATPSPRRPPCRPTLSPPPTAATQGPTGVASRTAAKTACGRGVPSSAPDAQPWCPQSPDPGPPRPRRRNLAWLLTVPFLEASPNASPWKKPPSSRSSGGEWKARAGGRALRGVDPSRAYLPFPSPFICFADGPLRASFGGSIPKPPSPTMRRWSEPWQAQIWSDWHRIQEARGAAASSDKMAAPTLPSPVGAPLCRRGFTGHWCWTAGSASRQRRRRHEGCPNVINRVAMDLSVTVEDHKQQDPSLCIVLRKVLCWLFGSHMYGQTHSVYLLSFCQSKECDFVTHDAIS